jgi:hypothetical protein
MWQWLSRIRVRGKSEMHGFMDRDSAAEARLKRSALEQAPLQIKTSGSLSRARRATADARRGGGGGVEGRGGGGGQGRDV